MKLYLMRHGHSPSASEARAASDALRPLSAAGVKGAQETAKRLLGRGGRPEVILHSPLLRAVQTAAEAANVLQPARGSRTYEPLSNALSAEDLYRRVRADEPDAPELMLVGHQPQLGELASLLTGQVFDLKPGGVIALEPAPEDGRGRVLWSANPGDP